VGLLIGVPLGLVANRQPGASPPAVALESVVLWRAEIVLILVAGAFLAAFVLLLSWRGLLICDAFERRRR
jgi:hypothetical protein